ncbi:hypothetical protein B0A53_06541, partial [Rhodotorula sp. CCFEE 5036]
VKSVTGNKILRILKTAGLAPQIPEDLYCVPRVPPFQNYLEMEKANADLPIFFLCLARSPLSQLIKKAVQVRKHLERNRHDKDSKFRLILIESRIHRLARYYRTKGQLPPTFKYESATASTMIA